MRKLLADDETRRKIRERERELRREQRLTWENMARFIEKENERAWNIKPVRRRIQRVASELQKDRNRYRETALVELNKTTKAYKYIAGHIDQIAEDLGGMENLSFNQRALVEQAALCREWLSVNWKKWLEEEEGFDVEKTLKVMKTMQNIMQQLGLERKSKEISDLSAIIKEEKGKEGE